MDYSSFSPVMVPGYESLYSVNRLGQVRSERSGRLIRPHYNGGYLMVSMFDRDKRLHQKHVHRLVAEAFLPVPGERMGFGRWEVYHLDGNPGNNRVNNLAWITHGENVYRLRAEREAEGLVVGRPAGFEHDRETRERMSLAKMRPVRVIYGGGEVVFGSVGEMLVWEYWGFRMYRRLFNRIMRKMGGEYRGFRIEYIG